MSASSWWREKVVKPIHNTKILLPRVMGVHAATYMQFVYFGVIFGGGILVMNWAIEQSHKNIGINGEKLRNRTELEHHNTAKQNEGLHRLLVKATKHE
jgi:hypothetical protein